MTGKSCEFGSCPIEDFNNKRRHHYLRAKHFRSLGDFESANDHKELGDRERAHSLAFKVCSDCIYKRPNESS